MVWFNYLKAQGYFNPESNPDPIYVKDGISVPYWESLIYLEKLSLVRNSERSSFAREIVGVIREVSKHPKDNYRTWYMFIKILSNLENEDIPGDILNFIPVWFSGRFDTMTQTSELCDKLLPKFLKANPTVEDVEKVHIILNHIFSVQKVENQNNDIQGDSGSYSSRMYLHFLARIFESGELSKKVALYCRDEFVLTLAWRIKMLLLDYPKGISATVIDAKGKYELTVFIDGEGLIIHVSSTETADGNRLFIENYQNLSDSDLRQRIIDALASISIDYSPIDDRDDLCEKVLFAIKNDLFSAYRFVSIEKLDDRYSNDERLLNVFLTIFRNVMSEMANEQPERTLRILKILCFDSRFKLPFFIRLALYVTSENWKDTNELFWMLVGNRDEVGIFSSYMYQQELFNLLEKNQHALTPDQLQLIEQIISAGDQSKDVLGSKEDDYWRLRWFASLRDVPPFDEHYKSLSARLKIDADYFSDFGGFKTINTISPLSKDDLIRKGNKELADHILTFHPTDSWEEPSVGGLAEMLGNAIEEKPDKFANDIECFVNVGYIYSYRMINAFSEAWKKGKTFAWSNVLNFCLQTLEDKKFYSEQLKIDSDSWKASSDWVVGAIARLLTDGLQNDDNAFDFDLLPLAKQIIKVMSGNLKIIDKLEKSNMDHVTYSLNSTAGKVLKSSLDYSLRKARNLVDQDTPIKWDGDMRSVFESALDKGIIDSHILVGVYFQQFYFLDPVWTRRQVEYHCVTNDESWIAFISGFILNSPPSGQELFNLFKPHYMRAIDSRVELKYFHDNGLVRHLAAFYFWGYELLSPNSLIFEFLNKSRPSEIRDLIYFVSRQHNYSKSLTEDKRLEFEERILTLWSFLVNRYQNSAVEDEIQTLGSLSSWISLISVLDEKYARLIMASSQHVHKTHWAHQLLEELTVIKKAGNARETAKYVGDILDSMIFPEYISTVDQEPIKDLIIFLFENGQNGLASKFCNRMAATYQLFFLRDVYEMYSKS